MFSNHPNSYKRWRVLSWLKTSLYSHKYSSIQSPHPDYCDAFLSSFPNSRHFSVLFSSHTRALFFQQCMRQNDYKVLIACKIKHKLLVLLSWLLLSLSNQPIQFYHPQLRFVPRTLYLIRNLNLLSNAGGKKKIDPSKILISSKVLEWLLNSHTIKMTLKLLFMNVSWM